jgi:hypothetical protein
VRGAATTARRPRQAAWADIGVGSVVLACEGHAEGWFESVVGVEDDLLKLKSRDYPTHPVFARRRTAHLGIKHEEGVPENGQGTRSWPIRGRHRSGLRGKG